MDNADLSCLATEYKALYDEIQEKFRNLSD